VHLLVLRFLLVSHFKYINVWTAKVGTGTRVDTLGNVTGERATVLVVDDDPSLRLLCRVNLELEGFRVVEAESVETARAALVEENIAVILLDIHLGNQDGLTLLPVIKEHGRAVALLTGSPGFHLPAGATVIGKPFSIDELTQTVRRLAGLELG
jgi:DNA-binding NtrC family response regulator